MKALAEFIGQVFKEFLSVTFVIFTEALATTEDAIMMFKLVLLHVSPRFKNPLLGKNC